MNVGFHKVIEEEKDMLFKVHAHSQGNTFIQERQLLWEDA